MLVLYLCCNFTTVLVKLFVVLKHQKHLVMEVQGSNIQSIGKKFWRLVEVYIFVMISTVSGSAITKDVVSAKSKAKDKTLRIGTELFITHASAPPHAANTPNHCHYTEAHLARQTRAVVQVSFKTALTSPCAIEKGRAIEKEHIICAARLFEMRLSAFAHQYGFQEHVRHRLPLNLATENLPLLI